METLYFYSVGSCSLGGMIVLEWLGQPYRLCRVDRTLRRTPAYLKINPLGKVPAMRVGDEALTENAAILTHLAERRPGLLPPHGTTARDRANVWLSYLGTTFHTRYYPIVAPQLFSPYESMHPALRETARDRLRQELAHVNRAIGERGFVVGGTMTVCDPYLFGMARWMKFVDMPREYPHIAAWQARMERDEGVRAALAIEQDASPGGARGALLGHVDLASVGASVS
jgi:glutathione S-transferase